MTALASPQLASPLWTSVCPYGDLLPERGVCALAGGAQVAVFRLWDGSLRAVGNWDPYGGAFVISRGIVGSRGDRPIVVSPLLKHAFCLDTGAAVDEPAVALPTYPVRVRDGRVEVSCGG
jgi:nitrite reductase (NADH) small subunit